MAVTAEKKAIQENSKVPERLIYEMVNGKPIYYRDYDKVLSGEKRLEEVLGSSSIQAILVALILKALFQQLPEDYILATNEMGFKLAPKSWRNLDIAIFSKEELNREGIKDSYTEVPPEVVIEIDTKADLKKYEGSFDWYMKEKIDDLLNAGVERVIWITTFDRKILVAEKNERWFITNWNDTIDVIDGIKLNLEGLLKSEGLNVEK
jgi:Uma2 family endonuclease